MTIHIRYHVWVLIFLWDLLPLPKAGLNRGIRNMPQSGAEIMRLQLLSWVACGVVLLSGLPTPQGASADEALIQRFLKEAPQRWSEYEALLRGFDIQSEIVTGNDQNRITVRKVFSADGTRAVETISRQDEQPKTMVRGSNPDYEFELEKATDAQDAFSVRHVRQQTPNVDSIPISIARNEAAVLWGVYTFDFRTIMASKDFRIKDAKEVTHEGLRLVEIELDYLAPALETNKKPMPCNGTIWVDPDCYWGIVEANITNQDPTDGWRIESKRRMEKVFRDLPVCVAGDIRVYDAKGQLFLSAGSTYQWSEYSGDERIFTLSNYGLPEPRFPKPGRVKFWVLTACVTMLAGCVGVLVYRRTRGARSQ